MEGGRQEWQTPLSLALGCHASLGTLCYLPWGLCGIHLIPSRNLMPKSWRSILEMARCCDGERDGHGQMTEDARTVHTHTILPQTDFKKEGSVVL